MALTPGSRLGVYEIHTPIGEGGMGQVYRARDTKLDRDVAIKILPEVFAHDADRLARFQREAKTLASLNHPNIAAIYGLEESGGGTALVMELVEGEDLSQQIARGAIPIDNALPIAKQITEALEAAHEQGVIHRDLKPANIRIKDDGTVKVLDFGLAKVGAGGATNLDLSLAPTVDRTREGVILGTAAYMSPEQARGKPVDKRTDIWAFGCVVYEMITGRAAFLSDTHSDTIAAILQRDPPWHTLPPETPASVRRLLRRSLEKDQRQRLRDIGDARIELEEALARATVGETRVAKEETGSLGSSKRPWVRGGGAALGVLVGLTGLGLAAWWPIPPADAPRLVAFATEFPFQGMPKWSPKGDRLAYVAAIDDVLQVVTKVTGSSTPTQLTHETNSCYNPLWSPDATRIYYLTGVRPNVGLRSVAVAGGASETILDGVLTADLSPDGGTLAVLTFEPPGQYRLAFSSPPGAQPRPYSHAPLLDFHTTGADTSLQFDPSGRYLGLYTGARSPDQFWKIPLDGTPPTELLHGTGAPAGSFAWLNGGLRIVSDAWAAIVDSRLLLSDLASGERRALTTELEPEYSPAVAPNGHTLAFAAGETGYDIIDVPLDGSAPHDLIATSRNEVAPAWTPDGGHVAYATNRNNVSEIWLRNVTDRSERRIVGATSFPDSADYVLWDTAISPDGSRIAYRRVASGVHEIWISPLSGEGAVRLRDDPAKSTQRGPSWSPDGNWIAYYGTREGTPAVFKMRVGANGPPEFLATMATMQPVRWSPRGDWIAFRDGETLRVVRVDGTHNHVVNGRAWETFDWSKDGAAILGITFDGQHRQRLARIEVDTGQETGIADLGPVPAALDFANYRGQFAYRGFALHPDGRRFLTSLLQVKTQIYFMEDLDRPTRLADKLWRRMGGKTP